MYLRNSWPVDERLRLLGIARKVILWKCINIEISLEFTEGKIGIQTLKTKLEKTLRVLYDNKDVVFMLPTGFGKSVIFQVLPFLMQKENCCDMPSVIVVAPLNAIMQDQVPNLKKERGMFSRRWRIWSYDVSHQIEKGKNNFAFNIVITY